MASWLLSALTFHHRDNPLGGKKMFYAEPSKARDEAIESAPLFLICRVDIVFFDDANLHALKKCKHNLLRAISWLEAFEM